LLDAVGPVVRDAAMAVVVAVAGVIVAALVLGVLRLRRRRAVLSPRVVRTAVVTAVVIPAAGVPLALVVGAAVWTGVLTVAAGWVMFRWVRVIVRGAVESRRPGAYEALPRPVRAPVRPLPAGARRVVEGTVVGATVLSRTDGRVVR
jgi:hypothetical protein